MMFKYQNAFVCVFVWAHVLMGTHLCVCVDLYMSAVRENKILGHSETHTIEQKYLGKLTSVVCVCVCG